MHTTTRRSFMTLLCGAAVSALVIASPASANELDDLKESFKQRYADLLALKNAGKVGETYLGFVEAVKGGLSADEQKIVDSENADRKKLYAIIAKQQNTTPELVAERNAKRNLANAAKGHWFKTKEGWVQK